MAFSRASEEELRDDPGSGTKWRTPTWSRSLSFQTRGRPEQDKAGVHVEGGRAQRMVCRFSTAPAPLGARLSRSVERRVVRPAQ